jgi:hypothetical protein
LPWDLRLSRYPSLYGGSIAEIALPIQEWQSGKELQYFPRCVEQIVRGSRGLLRFRNSKNKEGAVKRRLGGYFNVSNTR